MDELGVRQADRPSHGGGAGGLHPLPVSGPLCRSAYPRVLSHMPTVSYELPYEGAKEMLLVDEVDNKEFLTGLFNAMYEELPTPKSKKKK